MVRYLGGGLLSSCLFLQLVLALLSKNKVFSKKNVQSEAGQLVRNCSIFGQSLRLKAKGVNVYKWEGWAGASRGRALLIFCG